jgi:hypothetical protein
MFLGADLITALSSLHVHVKLLTAIWQNSQLPADTGDVQGLRLVADVMEARLGTVVWM